MMCSISLLVKNDSYQEKIILENLGTLLKALHIHYLNFPLKSVTLDEDHLVKSQTLEAESFPPSPQSPRVAGKGSTCSLHACSQPDAGRVGRNMAEGARMAFKTR